jgi:hypothetical protein
LTNKGHLLPPPVPEPLDKIRYCHVPFKIAAEDLFPVGRRDHQTGTNTGTGLTSSVLGFVASSHANAGQATVALLALAPVLVADRRLAEVALDPLFMEEYTRVTP